MEMLDSIESKVNITLNHHDESIKWGNVFWRSDVWAFSGVPDTWRINGEHWNCYTGM